MDSSRNINTNYILELDDKPCSLGIAFLTLDGNVDFRGAVPDIQRIDKGVMFVARNKDTNEMVISGEILRVTDKTVYDPVASKMNEAAVIEMEVETICKITYCEWFLSA